MRIALFTETFLPKIDGIVTRLKSTVEQLQSFGDQVLVVAPDGGLREYKGAKIYGVSGMPLPMYPELKIAIPRPKLKNVIEEFKPDLIHVVNPVVLGVGGIYYAKKMGIPLVASYHTHLPKYLSYYGWGVLEDLLWKLLRLTHNQAQLNLCPSTAILDELINHGIEQVDLWPKGVDTDLFQPHLASDQMRWRLSQGHPESPLLLYVGRVAAEKQIEQIKPILEAIPEARLAIVGDGPHRKALEKVFAGTRTNFVGYLKGKQLASAFASADVFVFPSQTETLGLVVLEAMSAGCPVVAAASNGILDIITHGVNGYLFDPNNLDDAIKATQKLLEASDEREVLKRNARIEAQRWSWEASICQLRNYYQEILATQSVLLPKMEVML